MKVQKVLSQTKISKILTSFADGVFTVDGNFVVTSFNRAAQEITWFSEEAAPAKPCCEVFRTEICEANCALKRTITAEIEARVIQDALARNQGNKSAVARELGVDKTTLWRKMKRLGSL